MTDDYFITGATGFVGGAIALELLDQTDANLHALVRADDRVAAEERLRAALRAAAGLYDRADLLPAIDARCHAIAGDITRPLDDGRLASLAGRVAEVWHVAGSRACDDAASAEAELYNVEGTRNVLDAAAALGATTFNHVSTAYVAGKRAGRIPEALLPEDGPTYNPYEASKLKAEHVVVRAAGLRARIFRPSLVVGHSQTCGATTFAGIYGFIREYREFCAQVARQLGSYLRFTSASVLANPALPINVVPVDAVARNAVRISLSASREQVFHLTNPAAPTIAEAVAVLARLLGVRPPRFVDSPAELSLIDGALNAGLASYEPFALVDRTFDHAHTDAVCGPEASSFPLDDARLAQHVTWYLRRLDAEAAPERAAGQPVATH
jgi:nucleoside-diphosphate-sugar epimerase